MARKKQIGITVDDAVAPIKKTTAKKIKEVKEAKEKTTKDKKTTKKEKEPKKIIAKEVSTKKLAKAIKPLVVKEKIKAIRVPKDPEKVAAAAEKKLAIAQKKIAAAQKKAIIAEKRRIKLAQILAKKEEKALKKRNKYNLYDEEETDTEGRAFGMNYDIPDVVIRRPEKNQPKPYINPDTRTQYSSAELKEFKTLIVKKLNAAQKDYALLQTTLAHTGDHGTDDTSPTFKLLEDGSDVLSKEETALLAARQEKYILNLQNALVRIENKTYGICRSTGKLISKERLNSVPHATLSIVAKLDQF